MCTYKINLNMKNFEYEYLIYSFGLLKSFEFFSNFKLYFYLIEFILFCKWLNLVKVIVYQSFNRAIEYCSPITS